MAVIPRFVEDEEQSMVSSLRGSMPFSSLREDGTVGRIGDIMYRDYEATRDLRSMFFLPLGSDRTFSLGQASGAFRLVDHAEALEPLLDLGFTPSPLNRTLRGGARLFAVLQNPAYQIPDPIGWDGLGQESLTLSVALIADARVGHGFSLTMGYFRWVCTNGLISSALQLGHWTWSHLHFTPALLRDSVTKSLQQKFIGPASTGPRMNTVVLRETVKLFRSLSDPFYHTQWVNSAIPLIRDPVVSVENNLSAAGLSALTSSLDQLSQAQETFTILDLLNSLTFAEKQSTRLYFILDRVLRHLLKILELNSFKLGL